MAHPVPPQRRTIRPLPRRIIRVAEAITRRVEVAPTAEAAVVRTAAEAADIGKVLQ